MKRSTLAVSIFLLICTFAYSAPEARQMRYLYRADEKIASDYPCEVVTHPYISGNGERGTGNGGRVVARAGAGEAFGPLASGSYLIRETLAPGEVRTRYLGVADEGWTVVQMTCGTTGDKLDSVVHARRVPMNYYVSVDEAQNDTTFLGWQRDYGDGIYLHLHPDSLGKIDPKFKTLKENWEDFTVPEIVERLKALDTWMQDFGFAPLDGFASYTPANSLIAAMRQVGWNVLHSIIPEQNWSDGHWAINHWGMPNQPFYIAADDFRKSTSRRDAKTQSGGGNVIGMGMNSYHLYMPHVVNWGDNVLSPSHFLRWHRTVESGDMPVRYGNFLADYLKVAEGVKGSPYFLFTGYEFGRTFGTRSMTVHNRAGCEAMIDKARDGEKVVFATASDVAAWYERFRETPPEVVFTQRDYLAGTRIMDKPIDSGPSIGMEMKDYKACFAHLEPLPFYHYDYTIPWHFKAADTTAPDDFAKDDRENAKVGDRGTGNGERGMGNGERVFCIAVEKPLPRITPVCLWDCEITGITNKLEIGNNGTGNTSTLATFARVFSPPVLDDGRQHTVVELPKGWSGELTLEVESAGRGPDKAEFGGLVSPLWRVQTIGAGARRHCYVFLDTPLLSPCEVVFTAPKDCRVDALEKPLGAFKAGERIPLRFDTRRTWFRFWGLDAAELQPDAVAVAAIEKASAEWKEFCFQTGLTGLSGGDTQNPVNLVNPVQKNDAEVDAFFKSVVPEDERLLLDVDCFGNCPFGERSRAKSFDRVVFAANDKVRAVEYADGGISLGRGRAFWVHPRNLPFQVEGLDTLGLDENAVVRVRLCTVADEGERLSYRVSAKSGWKSFFGDAKAGQGPVVWDCPKERTADGLFTFDVPLKDLTDGTLSVGLRTNQKQVLDDWFADGGFIARLERVVVSVLSTKDAKVAKSADFASFDARARAGENLTVVFFGGSLTWSANASEPNVTGFRGRVADYLERRYPRAHFRFVDAAIGGTGSELGIFRLERDVLSKKPDLVFIDFSCNDGGGNLKIEPTCCYEYLLRRIVGRGIPVVQMFFTFKSWIAHGPPYDVDGCHLRLTAYRKLAEIYNTGVGDVYTDGLAPKVESGELTVDDIWPLDGGHPCDLGYALFAEAGIAGFERAVAEGKVCRAPEKPVFGTVEDVRRINSRAETQRRREDDLMALASGSSSWRRDLTYRTSMWYDGLSSRWMDDVLVFSGTTRSPLRVSTTLRENNCARVWMLGVFGEADENALTAEIRADGKKLADFKAAIDNRGRNGRLFIWRRAFADAPVREFEIDPVPDGKGDFRIGAVCIAEINAAEQAEQAGAEDDLEALDHARGGK